MSKHVHLAREYFTEGEVRDLLQNANITKQNLHDFGRKRKVFYSRELDRNKKCFDIARLFLDWNQFNWLADKLDRPRKKSKRRPMHFESVIAYEDIGAAINQLKSSRGLANSEEYTSNDGGDRVSINSQYIQVDPSKAKYHQREEINTEIEIIENGDGTSTIYFEDDKRSEQIVEAFVGELRKSNDKYLETKLDKLDLSRLSTDEVSKFFLDLISTSETYENESVVKVKLQKPQVLDSDIDDESETAAAEVQHQLQNALLQGEGILETSFYQALKGESYFLSVIQWRFIDEENKKKIIFEAGLRHPKEQSNFYVEVSGILDVDMQGEYGLTPRKPKKTEKNHYTDIFTAMAFELKNPKE